MQVFLGEFYVVEKHDD